MKRWPHILTVLVLITTTFALYWPALDYPFVFDDRQNISENPAIRVHELTADALATAVREARVRNRVVANLSFALNHALGGSEPRGFRLVNIAIHAINACLVYGLILWILIQTGMARPGGMAFAVAMIWTVHPVQTQSVTYIVQRMNSLATTGYLLAFGCYLIGRKAELRQIRWLCLGGGLLAWVVALGSKEIAIVLPLALLLYEYCFGDAKRLLVRFRWPIAGATLLLVLIALAFLGFDPINNLERGFAGRSFGPWERLWTQSRVVVFYLALYLAPSLHLLNLDHHFMLSSSPIAPAATLVCILSLILLLWLAYRARRHQPLVTFGLGWFALHLLLESSVLPLELAFEHRLYLPSMGLALAVLVWMVRFGPFQRPIVPWLWGCALAVPLLVLAAQRNQVWSSEMTLWRDVLAKSPHKARAYNNIAMLMIADGQFTEARGHLEFALAIRPNYAAAQINMGHIFRELEDFPLAVKWLKAGLAGRPDLLGGQLNLGACLLRMGDTEEAIQHLKTAYDMDPTHPDVLAQLAHAYDRQGRLDEAAKLYRQALATMSDDHLLRNAYAVLLTRLGQLELAATELTTLIQAMPGFADAHNNLAIVRRRQSRWQEAEDSYRAAIAHAPEDAGYHFNFGVMLRQRGRNVEAEKAYRQAIAFGKHTGARYNLARMLVDAGKHAEARSQLQAILKKKPSHERAAKLLAQLQTGSVSAEKSVTQQVAQALQLADRGEREAALQQLTAIKQQAPDTPRLDEHLGNLSLQVGKVDAAIEYYENALTRNPKQVRVLNNLAAAYLQKGRRDDAIRCYQDALKVDPNYQNAKDNLKRIQEE